MFSVYYIHTETFMMGPGNPLKVVKNRRSQLVIGRTIFFTCEKRRSRPLIG